MNKQLDADLASLSSPWKSHVPTLTSMSTIVGRCKLPTGEVLFKILHPLESFKLMGWCERFWFGSPFGPSFSVDHLNSIVGNAWCMWHFVPLAMSAMGCCRPADLLAEHPPPTESESSQSSSD